MKKLYLSLIGVFLCVVTHAQIGQKYIDSFKALQEQCGGNQWNYKTIDELIKRKQCPRITLSGLYLDIDTGPGKEMRIFDMSNNNLEGTIPDIFFYNTKYAKVPAFWRNNKARLRFSHNKIKDIQNLYCLTRGNQYLKEIKLDNNQIEEFSHTPHLPGIDSYPFVGVGVDRFTIHQNEIKSIKKENLSFKFSSGGIISNVADTVRFDNNRLNFESLITLVQSVKQLMRYYNYHVPGNPNCYFDYYPQKPLGESYLEYRVNKGRDVKAHFEDPTPHKDNVFSWQLNGKDIPLSEGRIFDFVMNEKTAGVYRCRITNPNLPGIALYSKDKAYYMRRPGNKAVTDFQMNQNSLSRFFPEDCVVADFSAKDPDGDEVYYRLPDTLADNSHFRIRDAKVLVSAEPLFDRHYIEKYEINVLAYDVYGGECLKTFEITKNPSGSGEEVVLPRVIKLSKNNVPENLESFEIGSFTYEGVHSCDFSLDDEEDNEHFEIVENKLKSKTKFNFEIKEKYSIRVKGTTPEGGVVKKDFTIQVTDKNDNPDDITITKSTIKVNTPSGTKLGMLMASDEDPNDIEFSYAFAEGYPDNKDFVLLGNVIKIKTVFTDPGTRTIGVTAKDPHGAQYTKELTLDIISDQSITNLPPLGFGISNCVITNEMKEGDAIGTFYMNDPEGQKGEYSGSNDFVEVIQSKLRLKKIPDHNTSFDVTINCKDGPHTIVNTFTLFVTSVASNTAPRGFGLFASDINTGSKVGDVLGTFYMSDIDGSIGVFSCSNEFLEIEGSELKLKKIPEGGEDVTIEVSCTDQDYNLTKKFVLYNNIPVKNTKPNGLGLTGMHIGKEMKENTTIGYFIMSDAEGAKGEYSCESEYVKIVNSALKLKKKPEDLKFFTIDVKAKDGEHSISQVFTIANELKEKPSSEGKIRGFGLTNTFISEELKVGDPVATIYLSEDSGGEGEFSCDNPYLKIEGNVLTLKSVPEESFQVVIKCSNGVMKSEQTFTFHVCENDDNVSFDDGTIRGLGLTNTVIQNTQNVGSHVAYLFLSEDKGVEGTFTCDNQYLDIIGNEIVLKEKPEPGTKFTVQITSSNNISEFDQSFTFHVIKEDDVVTAVGDLDSNADINVYPNPAANNLRISGVNFKEKTFFMIYNMAGTVIKIAEELPIDIKDLPTGTYVLKFSMDDDVHVKKFIKK